jgi:hypothetical protein
MGDGIHRDDVPFEDVEQIEKAMQERFPGFKVQFVGDTDPNKLPDGRMMDTFIEGQCFDCDKQIPCQWPPENEGDELPKGWSMYWMKGIMTIEVEGNELPVLICPECEDTDNIKDVRELE